MSWQDEVWSYEGRLGPASWWVWTLTFLATYGVILAGAQWALPSGWTYVTSLAAMVLFRLHTAVGVKRMADQGRRSWPVYLFWFLMLPVTARPDVLARWRDALVASPGCCAVDYYSRWATVLTIAAFALWMIWRLGFGKTGHSRSVYRSRLG